MQKIYSVNKQKIIVYHCQRNRHLNLLSMNVCINNNKVDLGNNIKMKRNTLKGVNKTLINKNIN